MAQSTRPRRHGDDSDLGTRREARAELLDELLDGQPPLTEQELERARREWRAAYAPKKSC